MSDLYFAAPLVLVALASGFYLWVLTEYLLDDGMISKRVLLICLTALGLGAYCCYLMVEVDILRQMLSLCEQNNF